MGMEFMQDPYSLPLDQAYLSNEATKQMRDNHGRLPPRRPMPQMPGFADVMANQSGGIGSGVNVPAMQFLSQMMNQPGGGGGLMNFGTPWMGGTPVGLPMVPGRQAFFGGGAMAPPVLPPNPTGGTTTPTTPPGERRPSDRTGSER